MNMTHLGAAVVGTGFIGPVHVEGLLRASTPEVSISIRGILGSTPEKSRQAASQLSLPKGYASLADILQDATVDVVHLTTPNRYHFDQAKQVIAAGKHVLCEKPLAMTSAESAELVRLASAANVVAGVNYNIRYYPLCHEMRQRVQAGTVGSIWHVAGSYTQDWLLKSSDFNWRVLADEGGTLRAVADIGTHWLDILGHITGERVTQVCADLHTVHPTRQRPTGGVETFSSKLGSPSPAPTVAVAIDTEDAGSILFHLSGGGRGCMSVSQVTAGRKNALRLEIAGSKQSFLWESELPNQLWIGHRDEANQLLLRDPALLSPAARAIANYPGGHTEGFADTFKQCFREFYSYLAAVKQNSLGSCQVSPPFPTFADGHQEILLCEAIWESHCQRRWVTVKE